MAARSTSRATTPRNRLAPVAAEPLTARSQSRVHLALLQRVHQACCSRTSPTRSAASGRVAARGARVMPQSGRGLVLRTDCSRCENRHRIFDHRVPGSTTTTAACKIVSTACETFRACCACAAGVERRVPRLAARAARGDDGVAVRRKSPSRWPTDCGEARSATESGAEAAFLAAEHHFRARRGFAQSARSGVGFFQRAAGHCAAISSSAIIAASFAATGRPTRDRRARDHFRRLTRLGERRRVLAVRAQVFAIQ